MDKQQATKLVRDTFENPFEPENFNKLVKNLLKKIDVSGNRINTTARLPQAFTGYIEKIERTGKFIDDEKRELIVFIVHLAKETSLERARTMQRNFIASYLSRDLKDAALVAFVSPDKSDWRFSLIKMDYRYEKQDGKTKVKEDFTPARRWSFLVGSYENSHTAQSRLVPLLISEKEPSLVEIEEAFNIEKVTKEFFLAYRDLFTRVKDELDKIDKTNSKIRKDFEEKGVNIVDFAKKLLGQIVFLYFLQKKGWFDVKKNSQWGSGSKNFLRELFEKKHGSYDNFFNDILEPLFYDALSRDRSDVDHWNDKFQCKIPFLNGGLFDAMNSYDWVNCDILLPNDLFSNNKKLNEVDRGDGILDVFDRYNFTVREDEPLEKEVAIDPELLGKAYEKFNAIRPDNYAEYKKALKSGNKGEESKFNKQFGVYYTPREIVHYMCQQSLIQYLASGNDYNPSIEKEEFEKLIQKGEQILENQIIALEKHEKIQSGALKDSEYKLSFSKTFLSHLEIIDKKLLEIKVCDPAIGSGAFPVGMMAEIAKARRVLYLLQNQGKDVPLYDYKRDCIEKSLYGVDIDPGAVEIAKLRLWLSLIVDEDDIKNIKPLPNLDYKIMQGNSLLEEYEGIKLIDEKHFATADLNSEKKKQVAELEASYRKKEREKIYNYSNLSTDEKKKYDSDLKKISIEIKKLKESMATSDQQASLLQKETERISDELKKLHHDFFEETNKAKKESIRKEIDNVTLKLIKETLKDQKKENLLPKVEEFEKTNHRPYFLWKLHFNEVFREKGGFDVVIGNPPYVEAKKLKDISHKLRDNYSTYSGTADLYVYFYEKGIRILREKGNLSYITSNKFVKTSYGENLRKYFTDYNIIEIIDFTGVHVFEALVASCIICISKRKSGNNKIVIVFINDSLKYFSDLKSYINDKKFYLNQNLLSEKIWQLETGTKLLLKEKIESGAITLIKTGTINIYRGVTTGYNPAFIIDDEKRKSLIKEDKENKEIIKPMLQGRNIRKWVYNKTSDFLIFTRKGIDIKKFPSIKKHLNNFKQKLEPGIGRKPGSYNWYEIQDNTAYYSEFEKEKIIWGLTSDKWTFAYDNEKNYLPSNGYLLTSSDISIKFLLPIMNSKLMEFYFSFIGIMTAGGAFTLKYETVCEFPIKILPLKQQSPFISLVDKILALTQSDDYPENSTKQAKVQEYEDEIDQMVYRLYDLTPVEIKIVEESVAPKGNKQPKKRGKKA